MVSRKLSTHSTATVAGISVAGASLIGIVLWLVFRRKGTPQTDSSPTETSADSTSSEEVTEGEQVSPPLPPDPQEETLDAPSETFSSEDNFPEPPGGSTPPVGSGSALPPTPPVGSGSALPPTPPSGSGQSTSGSGGAAPTGSGFAPISPAGATPKPASPAGFQPLTPAKKASAPQTRKYSMWITATPKAGVTGAKMEWFAHMRNFSAKSGQGGSEALEFKPTALNASRANPKVTKISVKDFKLTSSGDKTTATATLSTDFLDSQGIAQSKTTAMTLDSVASVTSLPPFAVPIGSKATFKLGEVPADADSMYTFTVYLAQYDWDKSGHFEWAKEATAQVLPPTEPTAPKYPRNVKVAILIREKGATSGFQTKIIDYTIKSPTDASVGSGAIPLNVAGTDLSISASLRPVSGATGPEGGFTNKPGLKVTATKTKTGKTASHTFGGITSAPFPVTKGSFGTPLKNSDILASSNEGVVEQGKFTWAYLDFADGRDFTVYAAVVG